MKYWICLICSLCCVRIGICQKILDNPDTLSLQAPLNSLTLYEKSLAGYKWITSDVERDPQVALIAGLIVPGGGQLYNRQFWKLTIYYVGIGGFLYLIDNNTTQYRKLKRAYELRIAGKEDQFKDIINSASRLKAIRDQFRKNLELSYIGAVAFYIVGVLDGFVSAHLSSFDVTDDISLKVKAIPSTSSHTVGLSLTWRIP